ncbi:MAG: murein biosynthesis integral membrane protein MurJ [Pseudohongiellaceae bacterium]
MTDHSPEPTAKSQQENATKESSLLRASGVTGSMTMVSRVLGLVRDVVIARVFGVTDGTDAFLLANKIPNFMRRLFAEGAFNQAFVPVLSEYRTNKTLGDVQELLAAVSASLGGFLSLLTVFVVVAAPLIAVPIAYGFIDEPAKFALVVEMLRITFPYLLLISMAALCGATLNSYGKFAIPALTPALLNVSLISCSFILTPFMSTPELALAWGVLIAGFAQLFFQLPFLARLQLLPIPKRISGHKGVAKIKTLMLPALFGVSISQINLLLDTFIASLLATGSVTWLYYSDRLMELPLGTFGVAIAVVVLPSLSRRHADASVEEFSATLDWALRVVVLIALPATLGLILLAEPLLITLFENDNFSAGDVVSSSGSLRAYALGLLGFMAIKVFAPGFYARQDTATPVRIGIIAMIANMAMNLIFYLVGLAHVGLALATSLAAFLNAGFLLKGLVSAGVFKFQGGWLIFVIRLAVANSMMAAFLFYMTDNWQLWLALGTFERVITLSLLVIGGLLVYGAALIGCGIRWKDVYR